MNKIINNKKIFLSFAVLAILTIGIMVIPEITNAQYGGYVAPYGSNGGYYDNGSVNTTGAFVTPYGVTNFNNNLSNNNQYQYYNGYTPQQVTPTPVYTYQPTTTTVNSTTPKVKKVATGEIVASAKVTSTAKNSGISTSNLTSNALFGSNSIYPSSLLQWVLFGILILFIIVLIRVIRGSREKYFATPLKHD